MDLMDINIELCQDALRESVARLVNREAVVSVPLSDVSEVVVEWGPFPTTMDLAHYEEFLRRFTWVTNADNPSVEKHYIDGDEPNEVAFTVDNQEFTGRWRQAFVRTRRQDKSPSEHEYYVGITLRKGFITAYDKSELRMFDRRHSQIAGGPAVADTRTDHPTDSIVIGFEGVDPTRRGAVYDGIPSSYSDTSIDGESLDGKWIKSHGNTADAQDGSGRLTATFVKVVSVTAWGSLPTAVRSLSRDIQDPWANGLDKDDTVDSYYNIDPDSYSTVAGWASSIFTTNAPAGYTFISRKIDRDEHGAYYMRVGYSKISASTVTGIDTLASLTPYITQDHSILNLFGFEIGEGENLAYVWPNISTASRAACMAIADSDLLLYVPDYSSISAWIPWVTPADPYAVGDLVTRSGVLYFCVVANTHDVWTASDWLVQGAAWVKETDYKTDILIKEGDLYYQAQSNFTSGDGATGTFLTELAEGKWRVYWNYSDRVFKDNQKGSADFAVKLSIADWDDSWGSARQMGESGSDGWKVAITEQVSGVPTAQRAKLLSDMKATEIDNTDDDYANDGIVIEERQGFLTASKRKIKLSNVTTSASAIIIDIRPPINGEGRGIVRRWPLRTEAAKDALTAGGSLDESGDYVQGGAATLPYIYQFEGDYTDETSPTDDVLHPTTLYPNRIVVTDYGNGAYDVTQYLVDDGTTTSAAHESFFESVIPVYRHESTTRNGVTYKRSNKYYEWVKIVSTEKRGWDYVHGDTTGEFSTEDTPTDMTGQEIVMGSTRVIQQGQFRYKAYRLTFDPDTGYGTWA